MAIDPTAQSSLSQTLSMFGSTQTSLTIPSSGVTALTSINQNSIDAVSQGFSINQISGQQETFPEIIPEMRVRLSAQLGQENQVYGTNDPSNNILSVLHDTSGVLFPFTPTISIEQNVDYKTMDLTHTNWDINAYTRTPSLTITVSGKFTVQNQYEGKYLIAVLHFLRTASKMYFGEQQSDLAGLPPPILSFSGYGTYMFNSLKCVLKNHSYSLDDSVDYYNVQIGSVITRVPVLLTLTCTLGIQQTPKAMRKNFNLDKFRTGELMRTQPGWI